MLQTHATRTTDGSGCIDGAPRRRSIDAILARRQARLQQRRQVYAPDFLHGQVQLDAIYETFGERWAEQAVFVELCRDDDGEILAWTAAWFDERFLVVEQAVRDEDPDFLARLDQIKAGRGTVLELRLDQATGEPTQDGLIIMRCELGRLVELERQRLGVVRDKQVADRRAVFSHRDEVLTDAQTDVLSMLCLTAIL